MAAKRWRPAYPAINLFTLLAGKSEVGVGPSDPGSRRRKLRPRRAADPCTYLSELGLVQHLLFTLTQEEKLIEKSGGQGRLIVETLAKDMPRVIKWDVMISEGTIFVTDDRGQHEVQLQWLSGERG